VGADVWRGEQWKADMGFRGYIRASALVVVWAGHGDGDEASCSQGVRFMFLISPVLLLRFFLTVFVIARLTRAETTLSNELPQPRLHLLLPRPHPRRPYILHPLDPHPALPPFLHLPRRRVHIILDSPWCDFTFSYQSYQTDKGWDTLTTPRLRMGVKSTVRHYEPEALEDVYFSPAKAGAEEWRYLMKEGVRVYMMVAGRELFADEIMALYGAMTGAGVDVRLREASGVLLTRGEKEG